VTLRWTPSTDALSGVKEYVLERSQDGGESFAELQRTAAREAEVGFPADEDTVFRLRAVDLAGSESQPALARGCEVVALRDPTEQVSTRLRVEVVQSDGQAITDALVLETSGTGAQLTHQGGGVYEADVTASASQALTLEVQALGQVFVSGPLLPLLPEDVETDFGRVAISRLRLGGVVTPAAGQSPAGPTQAGLGHSLGEPGAASPPLLSNGTTQGTLGFWHAIGAEDDLASVEILALPPVICSGLVPITFGRGYFPMT